MNGYILTGGFSRRFGSDKALAKINNQTFTEELFSTFAPIFKLVSVVGKKKYFSSIPFVEDALDIQCPLVGVYTALKHSDSEWNFILNVDMPLINIEVVKFLISEYDEKSRVIVPKLDDKLYPLCAFFHSSLQQPILNSISNKSYKLTKFIESVPHTIVPITNQSHKFVNVNTINDLKKINLKK